MPLGVYSVANRLIHVKTVMYNESYLDSYMTLSCLFIRNIYTIIITKINQHYFWTWKLQSFLVFGEMKFMHIYIPILPYVHIHIGRKDSFHGKIWTDYGYQTWTNAKLIFSHGNTRIAMRKHAQTQWAHLVWITLSMYRHKIVFPGKHTRIDIPK